VGSGIRVVVGLGNPGEQYERTRHNVGFRVVDLLAERTGTKWRASRHAPAWCAWAEWADGHARVLLVKPRTFMNESGQAVGPLARWHHLDGRAILLVYDDVDLPLGTIRVRARGGSGGHRGVASVLTALGGEDVARVRVGIGRGESQDTAEYVLSPFRADEEPVLRDALDRAVAAVMCCVERGVDRAMNEFNAEPKETK